MNFHVHFIREKLVDNCNDVTQFVTTHLRGHGDCSRAVSLHCSGGRG